MLWKLRGTSVTEDLGEVVIGTVKVTRECIGDVVLPTREPLGILLDAGVEEERSMVACYLDANGCLDWVGVDSGELSEIRLAKPTCGSGALRH